MKEFYDGSLLIGGSTPLEWSIFLAIKALVFVALMVVAIKLADRIGKK